MDENVLIDLYERLRNQALGKLFTTRQGLGLALFMQKGMAAWAQAWTDHNPKVKRESPQRLDIKSHFPYEINSQITKLLTNMLMNINQ
jgi:tRNA(Met) C34 N-acetyltransferase TmcA